MTETAALVAYLHARSKRAERNPGGHCLVPAGALQNAADTIEALNEQVLAGGWGGGGVVDSGIPEVVTLAGRTPLDDIERRLAALEKNAPAPIDGVCEECQRPGPLDLRCGYCGGKVKLS